MGEPTFHESAVARGVAPDDETAQWLGEAIADDVETYEVQDNLLVFTRQGKTYYVRLIGFDEDERMGAL